MDESGDKYFGKIYRVSEMVMVQEEESGLGGGRRFSETYSVLEIKRFKRPPINRGPLEPFEPHKAPE